MLFEPRNGFITPQQIHITTLNFYHDFYITPLNDITKHLPHQLVPLGAQRPLSGPARLLCKALHAFSRKRQPYNKRTHYTHIAHDRSRTLDQARSGFWTVTRSIVCELNRVAATLNERAGVL